MRSLPRPQELSRGRLGGLASEQHNFCKDSKFSFVSCNKCMKICCFLFFVTCRPACRANVSARPQAAACGTSRPVFFVYTRAFPRHSAMFRLPGRPVLPSRTARFAMSKGLYCNALWPRWLRAADALAISSYIRRPAAVDMWRRGGAVAAVGAALAGVQPVRPCFVVSAVLKCGLNLAEMYRKSLKKLINVQNQAIFCRHMYADWRKCCIFAPTKQH